MQGLGPLFDEVGQMGSGNSQCVLLEAMLSFIRDFKFASEVDLPKDPLPGEPGFSGGKGKGKGFTIEQLRRESFNQDPFVPEFLYAAMKENKRFESMQVSVNGCLSESSEFDVPISLKERTSGRRRGVPWLPSRHPARRAHLRD